MNNSFSESYAKAGVDVTAGYRAVDLMKQYVARTVTAGVMDGIGGFGGNAEAGGGEDDDEIVISTTSRRFDDDSEA